MRPADNIEKLVKKLRCSSSDQTRDKIFDSVTAALESKQKRPAPAGQNIWRIIMKNRITKSAAAAVIIIVGMIVVNHFGGSIDMAGVAWAGVAEKVEKIQNYVYRMRQIETSGPKEHGFEFITETEIIAYNSLQYGNKTESYRGGELITRSFLLRQEKEFIGICPPARRYDRYPLSDAAIRKMDQMSPRKIVSRFMSADYQTLGTETINGIETEGVEVNAPGVLNENPPPLESFVARLWVDVETELPVWLELEFVPKGLTTTTIIIVDEFIWDVELDASDFVPNIPTDYTLEIKRGPAALQQKQPSVEKETSIEPYLSEFENMDVPDIEDLSLFDLEDDKLKMDITLAGHMGVWKAQDDFIRDWPSYSKVRTHLYEDLLKKLNIDNLSVEELVVTGLALREKFWQKGGCLSKVSYPFGYAARILLEMAHDKEPENMNITDELVESILSVEPVWQYLEDSDERIRNSCYREVLTKLRLAQFEQIKKEIEQGLAPTWKDFVRINDLAILFGGEKDYESGLEVIDWLILEANRGGWSAYLNPIKKMQKNYSVSKKFNYNIYVPKMDVFPEEYRYGRRLPSFQGPEHKKRLIPAHIQNPNPEWMGG